MAGTYGKKDTWEDAKVTVMEFLDDFYDESKDNFNQGFLEFERRLQNYFEYEVRGEDPKKETSEEGRFVCCLDGCEICSFASETEAQMWCDLYDGDHTPSYRYEKE